MTSNISKGLVKLKEESIKEGIKEGAKEKTYEIAKKAIIKGLDDESISELTGLNLDEIKVLRETLLT